MVLRSGGNLAQIPPFKDPNGLIILKNTEIDAKST